MPCALLLVTLVAATAVNPNLAAAERAYEAGELEKVQGFIDKALAAQLSKAERIRAHELQALTAAAFDDSPRAINSFVQALKLEPTYDPGPRVSPKVRGLYAEARKQVPLNATEVPVVGRSEANAKPPIWSKWWFWTAVGVVAAGAATTAVVASQPKVPEGNLPTGALK
jgi:hypothetical protein